MPPRAPRSIAFLELVLQLTLSELSAAEEQMLSGLAGVLVLPRAQLSVREARAGSLIVRVAVEQFGESHVDVQQAVDWLSLAQLSDALGVPVIARPREVRSGCTDPFAIDFDSRANDQTGARCSYAGAGGGGGGGSGSAHGGGDGEPDSHGGDAAATARLQASESLVQSVERAFRETPAVASSVVGAFAAAICCCSAASALLVHACGAKRGQSARRTFKSRSRHNGTRAAAAVVTVGTDSLGPALHGESAINLTNASDAADARQSGGGFWSARKLGMAAGSPRLPSASDDRVVALRSTSPSTVAPLTRPVVAGASAGDERGGYWQRQRARNLAECREQERLGALRHERSGLLPPLSPHHRKAPIATQLKKPALPPSASPATR